MSDEKRHKLHIGFLDTIEETLIISKLKKVQRRVEGKNEHPVTTLSLRKSKLSALIFFLKTICM